MMSAAMGLSVEGLLRQPAPRLQTVPRLPRTHTTACASRATTVVDNKRPASRALQVLSSQSSRTRLPMTAHA